MICPVCGALNNDNLQNCCACGNYLYTQPQGQYQQPNHQQNNYQQYQQPPFYQYNPCFAQPQKRDPGKVLGIVGFALSMGSLVLSDGVVLAIVGMILSAIGMKKSKEAGFKNGFAKAGLISGIIVTVITLLFLALFIGLYVFLFIYEMGPTQI